MAKYTENFLQPTHIFEVKYNDEKAKKFEMLKEQLAQSLSLTKSDGNIAQLTSINFHGTRMDNIYSIMHMGLLSHFSKVNFFFFFCFFFK
jgi:hypothetical protein